MQPTEEAMMRRRLRCRRRVRYIEKLVARCYRNGLMQLGIDLARAQRNRDGTQARKIARKARRVLLSLEGKPV